MELYRHEIVMNENMFFFGCCEWMKTAEAQGGWNDVNGIMNETGKKKRDLSKGSHDENRKTYQRIKV